MTDKPLARLDHSKLPDIASARLPATYQAAVQALVQCAEVDECKGWADRAAALASYAKQAEDEGLFNTAVRIQARAIRRVGELLKQLPVVIGRPPDEGNRIGVDAVSLIPERSRTDAAEDAGIKKNLRVRAVQIAELPAADFEAAVERERPATIYELAERGREAKAEREGRGTPLMTDPRSGRVLSPDDYRQAMRLQGLLRSFADGLSAVDIEAAVRGAYEHEHQGTLDRARAALVLCETAVEAMEKAWKRRK